MQPYLRYLVYAALCISFILHLPHLHKELVGVHAWRQTQTQSNITNFYEEDMNILNPRRNDRGSGDGILRMEFPLMQWLIAATQKVVGTDILVTRVWLFLLGAVTIFGMRKVVSLLFEKPATGDLAAWTFAFSPGFFYYMINPLPDNMALCAGIWGIAAFLQFRKTQRIPLLLVTSLLLAISALCKLPFILYFAFPIAMLLFEKKDHRKPHLITQLLLLISCSILPILWYITVIPTWQGNGIVAGIFENPVSFSQALEYITHHLVSTLPELFLNYASVPFFAFGLLLFFKNKLYRRPVSLPLFLWLLAVIAYVVYEINMISKAHDYYLFPFYPLLFMLVAWGAYAMINHRKSWMRIAAVVLLCLLPLTAWLRMKDAWNYEKPGFNPDLMAYRAALQNATTSDARIVTGNDISHYIYLYHLDRKGWAFDSDRLDANLLQAMISEGASYLYSDTRAIDTHPDIAPMLDSLVLEVGSFRVYRLTNRG